MLARWAADLVRLYAWQLNQLLAWLNEAEYRHSMVDTEEYITEWLGSSDVAWAVKDASGISEGGRFVP
jgi:hypothetical protein